MDHDQSAITYSISHVIMKMNYKERTKFIENSSLESGTINADTFIALSSAIEPHAQPVAKALQNFSPPVILIRDPGSSH